MCVCILCDTQTYTTHAHTHYFRLNGHKFSVSKLGGATVTDKIIGEHFSAFLYPMHIIIANKNIIFI